MPVPVSTCPSSRILVVDDTPANLQIVATTIKAQGYQVMAVPSGALALDAVARRRPDLILLDVMMPEMDGFEVCRQLKASATTRDIPVIFLTARTETADIVKGFEIGALDYVAKPFNAQELLARVNTHLTMDRLHRENERLLLSILPASIANRLKAGEGSLADSCPAASVLFADIVNFTVMSANMAPGQLVAMLDDLFGQFDELSKSRGVEKIKTIGDCYMAVCGVPDPRPDHAAALADMALGMLDCLNQFNQSREAHLQIRIGINSGPVVAGVIGRSKFIYDLWGDTVNTASRMETTSPPGRVQVTDATRQELGTKFEFEDRGDVEIKGKGRLHTWLLVGRTPTPFSPARDDPQEGLEPGR